MMPATVSELDNWLPLAQLMGRYFTVYFFELPGHGQSRAFEGAYSSERVAETVEAFIDHLGHPKVSLLGFSFGGVLTMKTLARLRDRIEHVILIAPAVSRAALRLSPGKQHFFRALTGLFKQPEFSRGLHRLLRSSAFRFCFTTILELLGCVEHGTQLAGRLVALHRSTYEVLAHQLNEMLLLELPVPNPPFCQPCFVAMSVHDPLLHFDITIDSLKAQFARVQVKPLQVPYHQPPDRPGYADLVRQYDRFIRESLQSLRPQAARPAPAAPRRPKSEVNPVRAPAAQPWPQHSRWEPAGR